MTRRSGGWRRTGAALLLASLASACSVTHEAGVNDIQRRVHARTGQAVHWLQDAGHNQRVHDAIHKMLERPLTLPAAEKIALLHDRRLQATFERLGIAQADLFQAGLIANPHLGIGVLLPTTGSLTPAVGGDFGFDFLSIITLAARKRLAEAELEEVSLDVAHTIVGAVFDVRVAYFRLQAARQLADVNQSIASQAQASLDAALALHEAGNIDELQLAQEQAIYEEMRLALLDSQADVVTERENLNRLMGLWGHDAARWRLTAGLAGIPRDEAGLDQLATLAIAQRLDLAALKKRSKKLAAALRTAGDFAWLQAFEAGVGVEREIGHAVTIGPTARVALPIFDQGQGRTARLRAALRRSYHDVTAAAVDIRAEVRSLRNDVVRHRRKSVHYRDVVIPLRERVVKLAMRPHGDDSMLVGTFELLQNKRREAEARREYLVEVRDYWIARTELTRAVGGRLPQVVIAPVRR